MDKMKTRQEIIGELQIDFGMLIIAMGVFLLFIILIDIIGLILLPFILMEMIFVIGDLYKLHKLIKWTK